MNTAYRFGTRVAFLFEKRNESYLEYDEVSITEEKVAIDQKLLRASSSAGWQEGVVCKS